MIDPNDILTDEPTDEELSNIENTLEDFDFDFVE